MPNQETTGIRLPLSLVPLILGISTGKNLRQNQADGQPVLHYVSHYDILILMSTMQ